MLSSKYGAVLGRFCPIHNGHMGVINKLIEVHGIENSIIILGSSNARISHRNLFSYVERRRFIKAIYPNIRIIGLGDHYDCGHPSDLFDWIISLNDTLEQVFRCNPKEVTFYSGNEEDSQFLITDGWDVSIVDRFNEEDSVVVSGQEIRAHLVMNRMEILSQLIDSKILEDVVNTFRRKYKILQSM
jgi:phosphopantetheine adenylyltransferase